MLRNSAVLALVLTLFCWGNVGCAQEAAPPATRPATRPSTTTAPADRWERAIRAFEDADRANPPAPGGLVLIGSSTFTGWKTADVDLAGLPIIRRGFGGSGIGDAVTYAPRIVLPYKPKAIIVFSGGNDLASNKTPEYVADQFKKFVELVHKDLPATKIYYLAIKPTIRRANLDEAEKTANRLIQQYTMAHKNLGYIDINAKLVDAQGKPDPKYLKSDNLHPSPEGYQIIAAAIREAIETDAQFAPATKPATKDAEKK